MFSFFKRKKKVEPIAENKIFVFNADNIQNFVSVYSSSATQENPSPLAEVEKPFIAEFFNRLATAGIDYRLINIDRKSDGTLNLCYQRAQIGRIKLQGKKTAMQILNSSSTNNVKWLYEELTKTYLERLDDWVRYTKNHLSDGKKPTEGEIIIAVERDRLRIEELNRISKAQSDALYEQRQSEISSLDLSAIVVNSSEPVALTYPERYFLEHISTQPVDKPYVQGYWYYEYGLEYGETVSKLISNRYLTTVDGIYTLTFLTVEKLKEILKENGLSVSGSKESLSKRVLENLTEFDIKKYVGDSSFQFQLTDIGKSITGNLPKSITKDIAMEDECLQFLLNKEFDNAYRRMCELEVKRKSPRGINVDWQKELVNGLSSEKHSKYTTLFDLDLADKIASVFFQYSDLIKACVILTTMLGKNGKDVCVLFSRITEFEMKEKGLRQQFISDVQKLQFQVM